MSTRRRPMVDAQIEEPLEQQVVAQPFAERPLRTDRVHRHQNRRLQQGLGRHTRAAGAGVHLVERVIHLRQDRVDDNSDPSDRMIGRDQVLGGQGRQHRQLRIRCTTHPPILFDFDAEREHLSRISAPCYRREHGPDREIPRQPDCDTAEHRDHSHTPPVQRRNGYPRSRHRFIWRPARSRSAWRISVHDCTPPNRGHPRDHPCTIVARCRHIHAQC